MSNDTDSNDFQKKLETDTKLDELMKLDLRKKALFEKELFLKEHRATVDLDHLLKNTGDMEKAKSVSFGEMSDENMSRVVQALDEYMEAAQNCMSFVCEAFRGKVPFFRKNLILILADTGGGKSTVVANTVFECIQNINPSTGKGGKVLVLTNEEASEDFYARISCLIRGWSYTKHHEFTDQQREAFKEDIPKLKNRLTVIGDSYEGLTGWTSTFEGIERVFENLIRDNDIYDAIVIDYYQNVIGSQLDRRLGPYDCQERFAQIMDKYKNVYPAPIILMGQINKLRDNEDTTPYNIRIKGRKVICDKATYTVELRPNYELKYTKWIVHKSRFTGTTGEEIDTGFDRGRYIMWDTAKKLEASKLLIERLEKKEADQLPIGVIVEEKKEEKTGESNES